MKKNFRLLQKSHLRNDKFTKLNEEKINFLYLSFLLYFFNKNQK